MTTPDTTAALAAFERSLATETGAEAPFAALQRLFQTLVGAKLFTVMTVDVKAGLGRRAYTSDPAAYPTSGTKATNRTYWYDIVHGERRPFVANTIADIAKVFPDHETIWSLGCGSVVNLPVEIGGHVVATVNILDAEHYYTPERVEAAKALALPAKAAYLAHRLALLTADA